MAKNKRVWKTVEKSRSILKEMPVTIDVNVSDRGYSKCYLPSIVRKALGSRYMIRYCEEERMLGIFPTKVPNEGWTTTTALVNFTSSFEIAGLDLHHDSKYTFKCEWDDKDKVLLIHLRTGKKQE